MKIGDKVRFLNTTGGGIVKGFQNKEIVLVEDEDGFDIPILARECVVIESGQDNQVRQTSKPSDEIVSHAATNRAVAEDYKVVETKGGDLISVYLAYLPIDIKKLSTTDFECFMVNDSNYYLTYNYMSKTDDGWFSRQVGVIEPNTKLFIEEFSKAELNDLENICIQLFAYKKDKPFALKNPFSVELRLDTVKFYKLHSFRVNDYFEDEALIYPIVKRDLAVKELVIDTHGLEQAIMKKESRPRKESIITPSHSDVLEIDLHIDELLDNTNGLSSKDILEYQLKIFNETMQDNAKNKGQKIVFIHGKGDGILKNAVLKELKEKYKSAYYQDASFREYGFGATMVTIK